MNDEKNFGKTLVLLRKQRKMTQQELAEKLETSTKVISRWENENIIPTRDIIIKIADILSIDCSYLINISKNNARTAKKSKAKENDLLNLILKSLALAMAIAVFVLNIIDSIQMVDAISMLSISIICVSFLYFLK